MQTHPMLLVALCGLLSCGAAAQGTKVLKGGEITESALIQALTPPPPVTRNIGLDAGPRKPAKPAQANVLIEFETNSTELTSDAKQKLDIIGRALNTDKLAEFRFVLEGHADPRGTSDWNQQLSEGRAEAVREYLVQNQGVSSDRLKTVGKGDREPLNRTYAAAPENRRVTILTVAE